MYETTNTIPISSYSKFIITKSILSLSLYSESVDEYL
jgi:hypothetical protein